MSVDLSDMLARSRRGNRMLFSRDSAPLVPLETALASLPRWAQVEWALTCAQATLLALERRLPNEKRPRRALEAAWKWARGEVKMPVARRAILDVHQAARECADPVECALCRAVGHACATVHAAGHAMGLPIYELSAIARSEGVERCEGALAAKLDFYARVLAEQTAPREGQIWAEFLIRERKP